MSETDTGAADAGPFAEQQRLFKLLSQDTRHLIIQELLGHPAHLMSLAELEYMTGKSQAAIKDQLETLIDAGLLARYTYEPSEGKRDLPAQFYGFTERGGRGPPRLQVSPWPSGRTRALRKHAEDRKNRAPRIGPSPGASGCRRGSP